MDENDRINILCFVIIMRKINEYFIFFKCGINMGGMLYYLNARNIKIWELTTI